MIDIWIDGSCRPKKVSKNKFDKFGVSTIGIIVKKNNQVIKKISKFVGFLDNNQVEYVALINAVIFAISEGINEVTIYTDSSLLEKQINGKYGCYSDLLIPYYEEAKKNLSFLENYEIKWVSRKSNREADNLCKKTYLNLIESNSEVLKYRETVNEKN